MARKIIAGILGFLLLALVGVIGFVRSSHGQRLLLRILRSQAAKQLAGPVEIGSLDGKSLSHYLLSDVVIYDAEGKEAVRIAELEIALRLSSLPTRHIKLPLLSGRGVVIHARRLSDGRLNLAALTTPNDEKSTRTIELERIEVDGEASWEDGLRGKLQGSGALIIAPDSTTLKINDLKAQTLAPGRALVTLTGTLRAGEVTRLEGVVAELRSDDLPHLSGEARLSGSWQARLLAQGPLSRILIEAEVTPPRGHLEAHAELTLPAGATFSVAAEAPELTAHAGGKLHFGAQVEGEVRAHVDAGDLSQLAVGDLAGKLHVDVHAVRRHGKIRLDGDVHGFSLAAAQMRLAEIAAHVDLTGPSWQGTARLMARGLVTPEARFDNASARLEAHDRVLTVALDAAGPSGAVTLAAHGRQVRQNAASMTLDSFTLRRRELALHATRPASITIGPLMAVEDLSLASGAQRLGVSGSWDRAHGTIHGDLAGERIDLAKFLARAPSTSTTLTAEVSGTLSRPTVDLSAEGLIAGSARLKLAGRYQASRISGQAELTAPNLERLPLPARVGGRAHLKVQVAGTLRQPDLELQLDGSELAYRTVQHGRLSATASYHQRRLEAQLRAEDKGVIELSLALPIDLMTRRANLDQLEAHAQLSGVAVAALPLQLTGGVVSGSLNLKGKRLDANLSGNRLAGFGLHGVDAEVRAQYANEEAAITVEADLNRAPLLSAHASSRLRLADWKSAPFDAQLEVPAADLFGGSLTALAELHGTLGAPWGRISAHAERIHYGEMSIARAQLEGDFDGETVSASLSADQPGGGKLHADLGIPLDRTAPVGILIKATKFRLAADNLGGLRRFDGKLDADLALRGTREAPIASGALHIRDGAIGVAGDPRLYQDITLDVGAHDDKLEIQKLQLSANGGKLQAKGHIELAGLSLKTIDLSASVSRLPVARGPVGAWIDAEVGIHGERSGEAAFTGTITVEKGSAHLPRLAGGRSLQSTDPMKGVVFTDAEAQRERARREAAERSQVPTTALLATRIPGPFRLRSSEVSTDLDGELEISVVGPVTRINGSIRSSGGWIELLGRRYDLDHVRIGFGGQSELDPDLDIRVTREVSDAVIAVQVQGTAKQPRVTFSSDPPIYNEAQIIGIVISGDPGQSRTSDRSLDQKVVGALSGVIVRRLKDQIAPGLPIDVLRVETGNDGYSGLASTRVEVGKYITDSIYVSYVHQFGELQVGTRRLNANEASVEWRFRRRFEINSRFGDAGAGALDLFWTFRY